MKTTSTITIKYPGHNTQKNALPLCALPSDTLRRANANFRKMDNATLQVDAVVNALHTKDNHLPTKYIIYTATQQGSSGTVTGDAENLSAD